MLKPHPHTEEPHFTKMGGVYKQPPPKNLLVDQPNVKER
jgi:hypothetical protein